MPEPITPKPATRVKPSTEEIEQEAAAEVQEPALLSGSPPPEEPAPPPAEEEEGLSFQAMTRLHEQFPIHASIGGNGVVQRVSQILMNATRLSREPSVNFAVHDQHIQRLEVAWRRGDEDDFFRVLAEELAGAALHIRHAGLVEDVPDLIFYLKLLAHSQERGFQQVGQHLVRAARAPLVQAL